MVTPSSETVHAEIFDLVMQGSGVGVTMLQSAYSESLPSMHPSLEGGNRQSENDVPVAFVTGQFVHQRFWKFVVMCGLVRVIIVELNEWRPG